MENNEYKNSNTKYHEMQTVNTTDRTLPREGHQKVFFFGDGFS
jgi:hypothetical protein